MAIYLQEMPKHEMLFAWEIDGKTARRVGVPNPESARNCYFESGPDEDIWSALRRQTDWFADDRNPFHAARLSVGEHYPRIARPGANQLSARNLVGPSAREHRSAVALAQSQLLVLLRQLERICQTIHPCKETWSAYGHDIRNLLILACTEVESHWRAVLVANRVVQGRYTTKDYVKLQEAMKLGSYGVTFPQYPWIDPHRPFGAWGLLGRPTQELPWYDSYNAVKHDRETSFTKATLGHVFSAVSANAVMIAAQFGFHDGFGHRSEIDKALLFTEFPSWAPSDVYIHPAGQQWIASCYPF